MLLPQMGMRVPRGAAVYQPGTRSSSAVTGAIYEAQAAQLQYMTLGHRNLSTSGYKQGGQCTGTGTSP